MPNRILREGYLDSARVDALSLGAETLFVRLLLVADDFGRFDGRSIVVASRLWPLRRVKLADVDKWVAECQAAGLVFRHEQNGRSVLEVLEFRQRTRANVSKYPLPSDPCPTTDGPTTDRRPSSAHGDGDGDGDGGVIRIPEVGDGDGDGDGRPRAVPAGEYVSPTRKGPRHLVGDYSGFNPPQVLDYGDLKPLDPIQGAITVTGDREKRSWTGWVKILTEARKRLGIEIADVRWNATVETFWAEMKSGEIPRNPGAAFTSRVKTILADGKGGGK
jgi:hypothetical protein